METSRDSVPTVFYRSTSRYGLRGDVWARTELQISIRVRDRDGGHGTVSHPNGQLQISPQTCASAPKNLLRRMDKRSHPLCKLYSEYCKSNGYSFTWQVRHVREGTYFSVIAFVSKDLIVLARKREFALEVCEITEGGDNEAFTLRTACILKLPSIHSGTRVRFHTRNRTPFASNFSTPALHSNRLPFRSSPADGILGFEVSLRRHGRRTGSELRRLAFWVHHRALRRYAAETARPSHVPLKLGPRSAPHGMRGLVSRLVDRISGTFMTPPILHWSQWGPQSTRWRECSDDLRDRQTLAGMRCAVVHQGSLTLMDFSPGRLAMLQAQNSGPESTDLKVVEVPTKINAGRCFVRDFSSNLPFCERTKEEIKNRVLMDDEWILQIEVRSRLVAVLVS